MEGHILNFKVVFVIINLENKKNPKILYLTFIYLFSLKALNFILNQVILLYFNSSYFTLFHFTLLYSFGSHTLDFLAHKYSHCNIVKPRERGCEQRSFIGV